MVENTDLIQSFSGKRSKKKREEKKTEKREGGIVVRIEEFRGRICNTVRRREERGESGDTRLSLVLLWTGLHSVQLPRSHVPGKQSLDRAGPVEIQATPIPSVAFQPEESIT